MSSLFDEVFAQLDANPGWVNPPRGVRIRSAEKVEPDLAKWDLPRDEALALMGPPEARERYRLEPTYLSEVEAAICDTRRDE